MWLEENSRSIDNFIVAWFIGMNETRMFFIKRITGGRLNKKDGLTRYGNSHVKDKTS